MMLIMTAPSRPLSLPRDSQVVTDKFVDPQLPLLEADYGDIYATETSGSVTLDLPSTDETQTIHTGAQSSQLAESDNQTSALRNNGTENSLSSLEDSASSENASETAQAEFAPDTSFSLASPFSSVGSCKLENWNDHTILFNF